MQFINLWKVPNYFMFLPSTENELRIWNELFEMDTAKIENTLSNNIRRIQVD